jgi:ATP-dependent helicase Lhr and Lhr-like helicase
VTADAERQADEALARRLRITWQPFYGRHGRLRPVQRLAMPAILAGQDALIVAPTASGKTEAACAPLIERLIGHPGETILYVSPTRALVNDLYIRLAPPIAQTGLVVHRRTGDHKDSLDSTGGVLLTTPESFDSMLCRGRMPDGSHILGKVTAVVLDEIHLIHGTARGEHVRWLIERLRRIKAQLVSEGSIRDPGIQVVALSATVTDPAAVAAEYLQSLPAIIQVPGSRQIEVVCPVVALPDAAHAIPGHLGVSAPQKVLCFSNSRKRVDQLARDLRKSLATLGYEVRAHHGSLSLVEREATEVALKGTAKIVVCATMTLEIGIDIGDVDLVVLDSPAPSVSSLLQRVGRGNRRTETTRLMMCSGSEVEALIHAAMLSAAREGGLDEERPGPQYAVARQQIASYIFQSPTRGRARRQVSELVKSMAANIDADALVAHLVSTGDLDEDASGVRLSGTWLDLATRGSIHSNIHDAGGYQVVDDRTGASIGHGIRSQKGRGLGVGGKLLEVGGWDQFKILVHKATSEVSATGDWSYVSGAWMKGAGQPRALRRYFGIPPEEWPTIYLDGSQCVFHFGGSRRRMVLDLLLELTGLSGRFRVDEWAVWQQTERVLAGQTPSWLSRWSPAQLAVLLTGTRLERAERSLGRPHENRCLPVNLRIREVVEWLDLEHEHDSLAHATWKPVRDPDTEKALQVIAASLAR